MQQDPSTSSNTGEVNEVLYKSDIIALPKDSSDLRRIYFKSIWDAMTEAQNAKGSEKPKVIRTMRVSHVNMPNKKERLQQKRQQKMTKACRKLMLFTDDIRHRKTRRKKTTTADRPHKKLKMKRNNLKRRRKKKHRPVNDIKTS